MSARSSRPTPRRPGRTSRAAMHPGRAAAADGDARARPWYNVDFNSRWFFVPGVIATLTLIMIVNLTSFAVVREREVGTLEQIMVTPIRPLEFILGKTIPYFLVGLALTMRDRRASGCSGSGAVPRQSARPSARNLALSSRRARDRPPDLDRLPAPSSRRSRPIFSSSTRPSSCRASASRSPACPTGHAMAVVSSTR